MVYRLLILSALMSKLIFYAGFKFLKIKPPTYNLRPRPNYAGGI